MSEQVQDFSGKKFKIGVFFNSEKPTGCDYYRAILPVKHLTAPLARQGIEIKLVDNVYGNLDLDAFVVHRQIGDEFLRILASQAELGKKIVWDHDDLLTDIPDYNPVKVAWNETMQQRWQAIKQIATHTTTTTELLARATFQTDRQRNTVLPNLIDLDDYRREGPRPNNKKIRFLYAGSETHQGDLDQVVRPIQRMIEKFRDLVEPVFFGCAPNSLVSTNFTDIHVYPPCPVNGYPKMLTQINPDIAICPLNDNAFNRCKSNCKAIEMSAAGAIVLAQKGVAYDHNCAWLLCQDSRDWEEHLIATVKACHDIRNNLSFLDHQKEVMKRFSWQGQAAKKWYDFMLSLRG